ncbi:2'-deoxycytidine 5'-triphosphate deaminase [Nisaea sp.]|uniref:2'-deoxycytidine 5'-triphosphate deaminase n=1 Tax=Nisaea sp. TaxID=2024842 RepID=UPI0032EDBA0E
MTADASAATPDSGTREKRTTGILPSQTIREMIRGGQIASDMPVIDGQIQPSSIDLRLGAEAYRVRASFLPGRSATVAERLETLAMHRIDLRDGAVLEKGCVYIVRLQESVSLPPKVSGTANPKSSTGRLDIFTRLITDHGTEFETVREGYNGPLYAEISPRTFSVLARTGSRLNQLRFRRGTPVASDAAMRRLQDSVVLVHGQEADIKEGVAVSVDLTGEPKTGLIGYKAKQHTGLIDIDKPNGYDVLDFWEPLFRQPNRPGELILDPDEFYILASKEYLSVPLDHAAEMRAYDTKVGEFRVHYAGFFDPGFGMSEAGGEATRGVLEVRSHDVPFVITDGQVVCRLVYEPLTEIPDKVYGAGGIGSNYQGQGLKLGKHFRSQPIANPRS